MSLTGSFHSIVNIFLQQAALMYYHGEKLSLQFKMNKFFYFERLESTLKEIINIRLFCLGYWLLLSVFARWTNQNTFDGFIFSVLDPIRWPFLSK